VKIPAFVFFKSTQRLNICYLGESFIFKSGQQFVSSVPRVISSYKSERQVIVGLDRVHPHIVHQTYK